MRKITKEMANAFNNDLPFNKDNTKVLRSNNQTLLMLHGNLIAVKNTNDGFLMIQNCGWFTNVTKERLNALPNVSICQKKGKWYLNGKEWNGDFVQVN